MTEEVFRKLLLGTHKLFDSYISRDDTESYIKRVDALIGDWGRACEAYQMASHAAGAPVCVDDVVRHSNPRYIPAPRREAVRPFYGDDPRQEVIDALAMNNFMDIFGDLERIKPSSRGNMAACCPFHEDSSPSFFWNTTSGLWLCRGGCGGGSVFDYEMGITGESYSEVLHRLAYDTGVEFKKKPAKAKMSFAEER